MEDASWHKLIQCTEYKTESAGEMVLLVDPGDTSRKRSRRGYTKKVPKPSDRIFRFDSCGLEIDRVLNAAIIVHKRGLEQLGRGSPEVTPVEIRTLPERTTHVVETGSPLR